MKTKTKADKVLFFFYVLVYILVRGDDESMV